MARDSGSKIENGKLTITLHPLVKAVINLGAADNPIDYDIQLEREQEEAFYNESNGQVKERLDRAIEQRSVGNYSTQIIKPMKKHQLLEKAMRDYPAGTVAKFKSAPHVEHISNGIFHFADCNCDGKLHILGGTNGDCFYSDGDWAIPVPQKGSIPVGSRVKITKTELGCQGAEGQIGIILRNDIVADNGWCEDDKWDYKVNISGEHWRVKGEFELLPASILSGKCAIQVNNEREREAVNRFTKSKYPILNSDYPIFMCVNSEGFYSTSESSIESDHVVISFADFAKELGIKVPVFVMKSEDGEDLFEGDIAHHVFMGLTHWQYNSTFSIQKASVVGKIFSTKAAAEAWIKEQNKPKEIVISYDSETRAVVSKSNIVFHLDGSGVHFTLTESQLNDIYSAYKSLQ